MKVLQFTILIAHDRAIIGQEDVMPHFYPYLQIHNEAQLIWTRKGEGTLVADNHSQAFRLAKLTCWVPISHICSKAIHDILRKIFLALGTNGWVAGLVDAFPAETVAIYRLNKTN